MKTYSNKSNAKRAAVKQGLVDFTIDKVEGGFVINVPVVEEVKEVCPVEAELVKSYGFVTCPHCGEHLSNGVGTHLQDVNGTKIKHEQFEFECLACNNEFGAPIKKQVKAKAPQGKGISIEKVREERNGVKRPSIGGVCRAVWDACDVLFAQNGVSPKPSNLKEQAEANGWNLNNVSIELYQWRKFNGLTKKK